MSDRIEPAQEVHIVIGVTVEANSDNIDGPVMVNLDYSVIYGYS